MFNRGGIKPGEYVFVVQKEGDFNRIIIGRIQSVNGTKIHVVGTYIRPQGLIERVKSGRASGRPVEILNKPDPNNCIFMLIDRIESGRFSEEVDQSASRVIWINENRYLVLDGWIKENFPDIFAAALSADTSEARTQARQTLIEKMNSLYERDLKDHVYAVARSAKIL
ncbi:MAG TPA: hypothetical protein VLA68_07155 [Nitrososphaera sp.]|nr:hypothetical protein [Nitrososphaera sp.]